MQKSTVIALLVATLCCFTVSIAVADHDYAFTREKARKAVIDYCHTECHGLSLKPPVPCCDVFEQAMRGEVSALRLVFTDRNLQSGDNESWAFTAWPLLHVAADSRFARFLRTLDSRAQSEVFEQVFYSGSYYSRAIKSGYFARKFPEVAAIYHKLPRPKASNQAMQPTAGRSDAPLHFMKTRALQAALALASGG